MLLNYFQNCQNYSEGSQIEMSNFTGSFNYENLFNCYELVLICAGSGFTPMIRLLIHAIRIESIK